MKKVLAATAFSLVALLIAAPAATAGDTRCGAPGDPFDPTAEPEVLGPVVVDNVIVPTGTICVLEGTQVRGNVLAQPSSALFIDGANVRGNVEVKEDAHTGAFDSTIGGSYKCDLCFFEDVVESRVGGSVQIVGAQDGDFVIGNVIGGNVEIVASSAGAFGFIIAGNEVGGSVIFVKNAGPTVIADNAIAGELQIFENGVAGTCPPENCGEPVENGTFSGNTVGGNMQVFENRGPTEISGNQVRQSLQCEENEPPPTGGGNTAREKEGQCRVL
jgi:hypothetical protein